MGLLGFQHRSPYVHTCLLQGPKLCYAMYFEMTLVMIWHYTKQRWMEWNTFPVLHCFLLRNILPLKILENLGASNFNFWLIVIKCNRGKVCLCARRWHLTNLGCLREVKIWKGQKWQNLPKSYLRRLRALPGGCETVAGSSSHVGLRRPRVNWHSWMSFLTLS